MGAGGGREVGHWEEGWGEGLGEGWNNGAEWVLGGWGGRVGGRRFRGKVAHLIIPASVGLCLPPHGNAGFLDAPAGAGYWVIVRSPAQLFQSATPARSRRP